MFWTWKIFQFFDVGFEDEPNSILTSRVTILTLRGGTRFASRLTSASHLTWPGRLTYFNLTLKKKVSAASFPRGEFSQRQIFSAANFSAANFPDTISVHFLFAFFFIFFLTFTVHCCSKRCKFTIWTFKPQKLSGPEPIVPHKPPSIPPWYTPKNSFLDVPDDFKQKIK